MAGAAEPDLGAAWEAAMRRGDWERAWQVCDRVLARNVAAGPCWHRPRHEQWVWDGRPVAGKRVLVRCHHGLGDTVQFARFLPRLAESASEVIVWAQPALLPLLATLRAPIRFMPLHDGAPDAEFDVDVESMELAHVLRVTLDTLPADVPYLHVAPTERPSPEFNAGVVASAGDWNGQRSMPPHLLTTLGRVPGVALFNLRPGGSVPVARDSSSADVLTATARVQALDLVITVDTFMAHLAGALGVPTWVLLPAHADWRWMEGRDDSPWYPTARLFRQEHAGDWAGVVRRVEGTLRACAAARERPTSAVSGGRRARGGA